VIRHQLVRPVSGKTKYYLSNLPAETPLEELA
jgi:hypothetical protein